MEDFTKDRLRVGVITSPHGVHGEVNVFPTTDDMNRFKELKDCYIVVKRELRPVKIDGVKFFKGMAILHFENMNDRNEMEKLRQCDILIDRENAVGLEDDEFFICDLIGMKVVSDEGEELGSLKDVLQTGANDVFVVDTGEKELLVPHTKECVLSCDTDNKLITVHLLPGLREL